MARHGKLSLCLVYSCAHSVLTPVSRCLNYQVRQSHFRVVENCYKFSAGR